MRLHISIGVIARFFNKFSISIEQCWRITLTCGVCLVGFIAPASQVRSGTAVHEICDSAARKASTQSGVPLSVLLSITRTETGRNRDGTLQPWPWTVNMEGKGSWFNTLDQAYDYAIGRFNEGARSFDVGCFQINYRWHGDAFSSIEDMFDPLKNATYAAKFLKQLHVELGTWEDAAGAYHSRTPKYADRYKARFSRIRAALRTQNGTTTKSVEVLTKPTPAPPINNFPLLRAGVGQQRLGSLMPLQAKNGATSLFNAEDEG